MIGVLALLINIAAGALAAQQRHGEADALAQLTVDLAVLCATDGTTTLPASGGDGHSGSVPHCQSCLPFFASALPPPQQLFGPIQVFTERPHQAPPSTTPRRIGAYPPSIGPRGPPAA